MLVLAAAIVAVVCGVGVLLAQLGGQDEPSPSTQSTAGVDVSDLPAFWETNYMSAPPEK
jgi:hypothetical protein